MGSPRILSVVLAKLGDDVVEEESWVFASLEASAFWACKVTFQITPGLDGFNGKEPRPLYGEPLICSRRRSSQIDFPNVE